jgi:hypothetical protein
LIHLPIVLLSLPHGSLGIEFPLLLHDLQSPSDQFVAQGEHGENDAVLFFEFFLE